MKNSIGSLAALAALAAPAVLEAAPPPAPVAASFSNVVVPYDTPGSAYLDFDGDSTSDFRLYSNGVFIRLIAEGSNAISLSTVTFGSYFYASDALTSSVQLDEVGFDDFTTGYYGVSFVTGAQTHTGWVYFDFTGPDPLAVGGGWQTFAGAPVLVGSPAIPEPSAYGAIAGAAALLGAFAYRRRRPAS